MAEREGVCVCPIALTCPVEPTSEHRAIKQTGHWSDKGTPRPRTKNKQTMSTVAPTIVRHSTCKSSYHDELRSVIVALQRTLPDAPTSPQGGGIGPAVEIELPSVIQRYLNRRVASKQPLSARLTPATRPRRARTDVGSKDVLTDDVWVPKHPEIVRIGFENLRDKYEDIIIRTLNRDYGPDDFSSKLMVGTQLGTHHVHQTPPSCTGRVLDEACTGSGCLFSA